MIEQVKLSEEIIEHNDCSYCADAKNAAGRPFNFGKHIYCTYIKCPYFHNYTIDTLNKVKAV